MCTVHACPIPPRHVCSPPDICTVLNPLVFTRMLTLVSTLVFTLVSTIFYACGYMHAYDCVYAVFTVMLTVEPTITLSPTQLTDQIRVRVMVADRIRGQLPK